MAVIVLATGFARADELMAKNLAPPTARTALNAAPKVQDPAEQVGDQFEGLMLQLLYNQMLQANRTVDAGEDNPFSPSHGEMIYRSMQEEAMLQQLAKRRPLGVGALVARQMRNETGVGQRILVDSSRNQKAPQAQAAPSKEN